MGLTVEAFRAALPSAVIYVYDNNSSDRTAERARAAGAVVRRESRQGKGEVVRRMFADIDADIYVLVDGDATYDATAAPRMVRLAIDEKLDFVNGARDVRRRRGLSARSSLRQLRVDCSGKKHLRSAIHRHVVRLQGSVAAVRQVVPSRVARIRNRNRTHRACARTPHAVPRGADGVSGKTARLRQQAEHLS